MFAPCVFEMICHLQRFFLDFFILRFHQVLKNIFHILIILSFQHFYFNDYNWGGGANYRNNNTIFNEKEAYLKLYQHRKLFSTGTFQTHLKRLILICSTLVSTW